MKYIVLYSSVGYYWVEYIDIFLSLYVCIYILGRQLGSRHFFRIVEFVVFFYYGMCFFESI